jgi:phosphotriesterase-related protein
MEGTDIKPGILKCAVDELGMAEDAKKRNSAVAIVQVNTGLPLYTHCSHVSSLAMEQIDVLLGHGANPKRVVIRHVSRRMEVDYLESLLKRGVHICIEQSHDGDEEKVAGAVLELCKRGYAKQLLFSHDRCLYNEFATPGKSRVHIPEQVHVKSYSVVSQILIPAYLQARCSKEECEDFVRGNAMRFLNV